MSIHPCEQPECTDGSGPITHWIRPKEKSIGDFAVRRALPAPTRQRVGPFIFFDHMGPATFEAGQGMNVRPHPHIGLSTVTFLFEGVIRHQDSLGFDQDITPGAVNWMTAGRGIVHSERTPKRLLEEGSSLSGFQAWIALPTDEEESEPSFTHYPASSIPEIELGGGHLSLVAGTAYGATSPVKVASEMFYLAGTLSPGAEFAVTAEHEERAVYVAEGSIVLDSVDISAGELVVLRPGGEPTLTAGPETKIALFGGAPLPGERHLYWNFVSSRTERLEQAKDDWREGRFDRVEGDPEFIPLPGT